LRFQLVDRIDGHTPWGTIAARKLTSLSEDIWEGSPLEMPAPLILESLGQAGGWLILLSSQGTKRGLLVSIGSVTFGDPVRPGDVLELEGRIDSNSEEAAVMSGRVTVAGRTVLEAEGLMAVLVDAATLEDPKKTESTRSLLVGDAT
jgi:3-hydroxyacyl-[acyl-carrier-protein] dehydratase